MENLEFKYEDKTIWMTSEEYKFLKEFRERRVNQPIVNYDYEVLQFETKVIKCKNCGSEINELGYCDNCGYIN